MNKYTKLSLGGAAGAILGYAYFYFIGCGSGTCPLTSNWHISTLYGAVVGLALAFPVKKKEVKSNENEETNK
ncbi:MAG: DUF6132 family protein [bacterium]